MARASTFGACARLLFSGLLLVGGGAGAASSATQCKIIKTPDGFVALRAGPSANTRMIVRMRFGDEVEITSAAKDPWFNVRRWRGPIPYYKTSSTPILSGYVHKRYLNSCDI